MSALASGWLLGAFIRELELQISEVVRLERNGYGRIGGEFSQSSFQFRDQFRRFLPVGLEGGVGEGLRSQESIEPLGQPNQITGRQPLNLLLDLLDAHEVNLAVHGEFATGKTGEQGAAVFSAMTNVPALRRHPLFGVDKDVGVNEDPPASRDGVHAHCSKKSASMLARNGSGVSANSGMSKKRLSPAPGSEGSRRLKDTYHGNEI